MIARWWNAAGAVWLLLAAVAHAAPAAPAAVAVNGNRPTKIEGMSSGRTMIVDLGMVVPITTVRLTVSGTTYPGLAGIEIHPSRRPAARESLTPPASLVE